ncbi:hypothetical protein FNP19_RS07690 [Enterococcus hirae]|nr:hypothetical protein [Enterococcus hirae]OQO33494.1 hypothetical protein BH731_11340 [Enterococcus hirae]OQO39279.1 hypothetical protein BH738_01435 [Enterococcus hirae]
MNGGVYMSGAYEEEIAKQERMEQARILKGEKRCDNCGKLFYPSKSDPEQFVCDKCFEYAINKD